MKTLTTNDVTTLLASLFPDDEQHIRNGYIDKQSQFSIGVMMSEERFGSQIAIGGLDCTPVKALPTNIRVRWGSNTQVHDDKVVGIYNTLLEHGQNFSIGDKVVAYIQLLDSAPISLGRDDINVCESIIRANFHYYLWL